MAWIIPQQKLKYKLILVYYHILFWNDTKSCVVTVVKEGRFSKSFYIYALTNTFPLPSAGLSANNIQFVSLIEKDCFSFPSQSLTVEDF